MVRCSRPLTTYPARANRSKTLFWAICVAVEDEAWSDIAGTLLTAEHRHRLRCAARSIGDDRAAQLGASGVRDVTRPWASMVGLACRRRLPRGVSRVSESCRGLSSGVCVSGSILSARSNSWFTSSRAVAASLRRTCAWCCRPAACAALASASAWAARALAAVSSANASRCPTLWDSSVALSRMSPASTRRCWVRLLRATHAIAAMARIAATATTTIKTMVLVVMSTPWIG